MKFSTEKKITDMKDRNSEGQKTSNVIPTIAQLTA